MTVKDDGISVYIDFGDSTSSYSIKELYNEGYISKELYTKAVQRQEELDNKPF